MADGLPELVELPLVYTARHMPARRKQAETSTVLETAVVRVPAWTGQQAPQVGMMVERDGTTTHYRGARGGDGVVRLMAALESAAFAKLETFNDVLVQQYSLVRALRYDGGQQVGWGRTVPAGSPAIGALLSSNRTRAVQHAASIRPTLAMVDGVLYGPCPEPGWNLDFISTGVGRNYRLNGKECVDFCNARAGYMQAFVPFCRDPQQQLEAMGIAGHWPAVEHGQIVEHVRAGFGGDAPWTTMLLLASQVRAHAHTSMESLMEDERQLVDQLDPGRHRWPERRDAEMARKLLTLVRIVHAISATKNSELLERVIACNRNLAANPEPMPLEDRLELAGIAIPQLPDPDRAPGIAPV